MLRHIFKMHVPLFVPARNLLRNMVHVSNQRLMPYPYNLPMPISDRSTVETLHPYDSFVDTARWPASIRGIESRYYWAEYSEYLMLPCLRYFTSTAELLAKLQVAEGGKISVQMRAAWLQDMEEMKSFWVRALGDMMRASGFVT